VDAGTNTDLLVLSDNLLVDISGYTGQQFNIRANISGEDVKSIEMELQGPVTRTWLEHEAPFSLFGDLSGNYFGAALAPGDYVLSGTPYTGIDASGDQGAVKTVSFTITSSAEAANQPPEAVAIATPISGYLPLQVYFDGTNSTDDQEILEFLWEFDDGNSATTATASHTFTAAGSFDVSFTVTDAGGLTDSKIVVINVQEPELPQSSGFTLVKGTTNTDLLVIRNNMEISADSIVNQKVNIRANLVTDKVQSVAFVLNGVITRAWVENEAPFMLFGDHGAENQGQLLIPGEYFLEARAYSGTGLTGSLLETIVVEFEVVGKTPKEDRNDSKANTLQNPLQDLSQGAVILHPNPANYFLNIEIIDSAAKISKILIYDISGSLVQRYLATETILAAKGVYKIDTSVLPAGIYLLKVFTSTFSTLHYKMVVKGE
jgi:PKD repeat protein